MKKILILILIVLNLIANDELPKWIDDDPDIESKYFRGVSTWYVSDDYRMKDRAYKDALNNGYISLGNYFGMNVKSELIIDKESNNFGNNKKIKKISLQNLIK